VFGVSLIHQKDLVVIVAVADPKLGLAGYVGGGPPVGIIEEGSGIELDSLHALHGCLFML
jgi:hypothetical protein